MKIVEKIRSRLGLDQVHPTIRKLLVSAIGATLLLAGLLMIFLPGPGIFVVLIGLALLATEFVWARRLIRRGRVAVKRVGRTVRETVKS